MEPTIIKFSCDSATDTVQCEHFGVTIKCDYDTNEITDINCSEDRIFIHCSDLLYSYDTDGNEVDCIDIGDNSVIIVANNLVCNIDSINECCCIVFDGDLNLVDEMSAYEPIVLNYEGRMLAKSLTTKDIIEITQDDSQIVRTDIAEIIENIYEDSEFCGLRIVPKYIDYNYAYIISCGLKRINYRSENEVEEIEPYRVNEYYAIKPFISSLKFSD